MLLLSCKAGVAMNTTKHAAVRAQQRCIPPIIIYWLMDYGHREKVYGAERITFDKKARRNLAKDVGTPVVKLMARYLNTCIVVDSDTEKMITAMWIH